MVVAGDHPHAECRERSCGDWGKRVRIKLKKIKDIYKEIVMCVVNQHITYPYIKNSSINSNVVDTDFLSIL